MNIPQHKIRRISSIQKKMPAWILRGMADKKEEDVRDEKPATVQPNSDFGAKLAMAIEEPGLAPKPQDMKKKKSSVPTLEDLQTTSTDKDRRMITAVLLETAKFIESGSEDTDQMAQLYETLSVITKDNPGISAAFLETLETLEQDSMSLYQLLKTILINLMMLFPDEVATQK